MNSMVSSSLKIIGIILVVISIAMLPPVLVCLYYGELSVAWAFGRTIMIGMAPGVFLYAVFRKRSSIFRVRDGFLVLSVAWLTAAVFGAFPYVTSGATSDDFSAFFEAASGFSTTGATVFTDVEALPHGILLWRSMTSWMGGLGILVFAVALLPNLGINGTNVAEYDRPSVSLNRLTPKAKRLAFGIASAYVVLTLAEAFLLALGDMHIFDSVIHAMSTVSTGGFSCYNDGIMHFDSIYLRLIVVIFMLICGVNFTMYYSFSRRGIRAFTENTEFKAYILIMVIAFAIVFTGLYFMETGWTHTGEAANSAFQVISILTTTGFVSDNFTIWPAFCQMILILLMFIGGCSSSASSGNKVVRLVVLVRLVVHSIQTKLHSNVIKPVTLNKRDVPNDTVSAVSNHMFLYIVMLFAGSFVMTLENIDLLDCFTATISLLGNVGPCFGSIGMRGDFSGFGDFAKFFMSLVMIAGRLELYTFLILFTPGFWRAD